MTAKKKSTKEPQVKLGDAVRILESLTDIVVMEPPETEFFDIEGYCLTDTCDDPWTVMGINDKGGFPSTTKKGIGTSNQVMLRDNEEGILVYTKLSNIKLAHEDGSSIPELRKCEVKWRGMKKDIELAYGAYTMKCQYCEQYEEWCDYTKGTKCPLSEVCGSCEQKTGTPYAVLDCHFEDVVIAIEEIHTTIEDDLQSRNKSTKGG